MMPWAALKSPPSTLPSLLPACGSWARSGVVQRAVITAAMVMILVIDKPPGKAQSKQKACQHYSRQAFQNAIHPPDPDKQDKYVNEFIFCQNNAEKNSNLLIIP